MVPPGEDFEEFREDATSGPLLPKEDRLWRHPSEVGAEEILSSAQAVAARRRWLANTPSRAGAGAAGLVGALLATGVVLVGMHVSSWLNVNHESSARVSSALVLTDTTTTTAVPSVAAGGAAAVLASLRSSLVEVRAYTTKGALVGDGVVISSTGDVLAPAALVAGAMSVSVVRPGGEELVANVLGSDPETGISLLKVPASGLSYMKLSSTSPSTGQFVLVAWRGQNLKVAIGRLPADTQPTSISDGPALLEYCPTSLGLSSAPEGALIVGSSGEVEGMVSARRGTATVSTPGWLAGRVVAELMANGHVVHGWLGIEGRSFALGASTTTSAPEEGLSASSSSRGVEVTVVKPRSAAARAGIRRGDVIEAVDGRPVPTMAALQAVLYLMPPESAVSLRVDRAGELSNMSTRLKAAA